MADVEIRGVRDARLLRELRRFAGAAREHVWGADLSGLLLVVRPLDVHATLIRYMTREEVAQVAGVDRVRTAPAGARSFIARDGRSTAVVPDVGFDYVRDFATHELLHFAEHQRQAADGYQWPPAGTASQLAAVYRSEYTVERTRCEVSRELGWQPNPYDEAGWVLDGTDREIEHSVASLRGARGRDRAWQTVGDFFRMWVMALGGRQGWVGAGELPARPFVDWPWLGFAASLADAYAAADRPLNDLDSIVLDRGLGPLLESARLRLPG